MELDETVAVVVAFLSLSALLLFALFAVPSGAHRYVQNLEVIEWTDWRGRKRRVEIHRRIE